MDKSTKSYVDLRVLVVSPKQEMESRLQVAMGDFRFARLVHTHDVESACDQLMLNGFDMVVIEGLPHHQYHDLVHTLRAGTLGNSPDLPVEAFGEASQCAHDHDVHVHDPDMGIKEIGLQLLAAFARATRFQTSQYNAFSRMLRNMENTAA